MNVATVVPAQQSSSEIRILADASKGDSFAVEVIDGEAADRFLASGDSAAAWDALLRRCPWATAFQSRAFVSSWMDVYRGSVRPLFVVATSPGGSLVGLLTLAVDRTTGALVVAGAHQAEYHTWLADPVCADQFAVRAFSALRRKYPRAQIVFRYLAPGTPTTWRDTTARWRRLSVVETRVRALVDLSGAAAEEALRKSSNRSRVNRMRRVGAVSFERITDPQAFAQALDELIPIYDLRQAAVNGVLPFGGDPQKRAFHERLFAAGLLHVTVLKVGHQVAAAHLGVIDGDRVSLGVFAHSPFFAKHSPGKVLLHMLFAKLRDEGFSLFDMTPGEGWKERFQSRCDEVATLTVCLGGIAASMRRLRLAADRVAKRTALAFGTTPDAVRAKLAKVRGVRVVDLKGAFAKRVRAVKNWVREDVEYCIYNMDAERAARADVATPFATNKIADLLIFDPMEPWQTKQGFFNECMERLANGDHVFTFVEGGHLLSYGWLVPSQRRSYNSEVKQEVELPEGSAVAYDYHTHPLGRGRGLHKSALATALRDGAAIAGTTKVWTGVLADNGPSRHNCIKMGWTHHSSLWMRKRFGRPIAAPATTPTATG